MAADKVEYADGEHEATLRYLDAMHHETREQTIARLEAALKVAKASVAKVAPLATHTEAVTREVTDAPPEPKVKPRKAAKAAKKAAKADTKAADAAKAELKARAQAAKASEPTASKV